MNNARGYLLTWALCVVFLLSGCSGAWEATKKVGKVVMDPDIPVGQATDQPSTVRLTLLSDPDTNPNEKGEAVPTEIVVVYLSENSKLLAADYDQLSSDAWRKRWVRITSIIRNTPYCPINSRRWTLSSWKRKTAIWG